MYIFEFNTIYTKFYADFRSGLRCGCYQQTISSYDIYLTFPSVDHCKPILRRNYHQCTHTRAVRHLIKPPIVWPHAGVSCACGHTIGSFIRSRTALVCVHWWYFRLETLTSGLQCGESQIHIVYTYSPLVTPQKETCPRVILWF